MPRKKRTYHPTSVPYFRGTNYELGVAIARLRYDCLLQVFAGIYAEVSRARQADRKRGYVQLAGWQRQALKGLGVVRQALRKMLVISLPYMDHEFERQFGEKRPTLNDLRL